MPWCRGSGLVAPAVAAAKRQDVASRSLSPYRSLQQRLSVTDTSWQNTMSAELRQWPGVCDSHRVEPS
ncbi:hypothetical protein CDL15_Pgr021539 [Punica granatum]|uniref:Uncharacterized protein n=1 Tax=Punica granatum TaxID=22663 RepID=A0A218XQB7_PUNGR|nr:hypothetical protein CDL15_Pgr021539 [Punica granatum]